MNDSLPFISVVVVAHNRREFIMEALKSLSVQSLNREHFEVIVVKNFTDNEIDGYAEDENFKLILTKKLEVGSKMAEGILESRGEVVTFLEDDDIFEKDKLSTIYSLFEKDDALVFVHDSYTVINEEGRTLIANRKKGDFIEALTASSFLEVCLRNKLKASNFAYSSCISIRRRLILSDTDSLGEIEAAPDYFLILSFLNSQSKGLFLAFPLTRYRLHSSQSIRSGTFAEFIRGNREIRDKWIKDYQIMASHFGDRLAQEVANYFLSYNKLILLTLRSERSISKKFRSIMKLFASPSLFRFYSPWSVFLISAFSSFSPLFAQKLYHSFHKKRYFGL